MEHCFLIVGLGNPGREYARTRHNAGFAVADRLAQCWQVNWSFESKFNARVALAPRAGRTVLLCQPQSYMNASGEAVAAVRAYYQVALSRLLVVVDDADLPLGEVRLRPRGSSGGHHGLESIEQHLGSQQFARLRLGIGRAATARREITNHVLGRFSPDEQNVFEQARDRAVSQIECWLTHGIQKAMNDFNGAVIAPATLTSL